jgi:hypothetical protein
MDFPENENQIKLPEPAEALSRIQACGPMLNLMINHLAEC